MSSRVVAWSSIGMALIGAALIVQSAWIPAKAVLAQHLIDRAWHESRRSGKPAAPWPWADTTPFLRLSVDALDAEFYVLAGSSPRNLAFGPAHMSASARPGERGNAIIAGHRDTHFAFLEHIEIGHALVIDDLNGEQHVFDVSNVEVVDSGTSGLLLGTTEATLTLVTCYPFDAIDPGGPLRLVVTARARADEAGADRLRDRLSSG